MKRPVLYFAFMLITFSPASPLYAGQALEPWTYSQNFETREVSAWASYPLWQDTAYDDNFYAGNIAPGDPNVSIVQLVTPQSHNDAYAGAQKKLDMFMTPSSKITVRFYIKSHLKAEYLKVRIATGKNGKVDYTISDPPMNRWVDLTVGYTGFIAENPRLAGSENIQVYGLAFLVKIPGADPDMPIHLGIDDVVFTGARSVHFRFIEPKMHKLPEWEPYIPHRHYHTGDTFSLSGKWECNAERVDMVITPFTDRTKTVLKSELRNNNGLWSLKPFKVTFDPGLYHATQTAISGSEKIADTEFTMYVAPENGGSTHPRLWFGEADRKRMAGQLKSGDYDALAREITAQAEKYRKNYPLDILRYDFDQFPDENWLVTRYAWSLDRIRSVGEAAFNNALAYSLLGDRKAGDYARDVLVAYAGFPSWNHPWMIKRGRHFYLLMGDMAMYFAHAYDLTCDLMTGDERELVRRAFMNNVIEAAHRAYVHANLVTSNTSNWIAAIMGGSIACQAAIYGESPETEVMEPMFTGSVMKMNALIRKAIGSDGGYGEGYNYYHYSSRSWSKSLPALERVFGIDLSAKLNGAYDEFAWAGIVRDKTCFYFGDSRGALLPMEAWAWLLPKYRDPLLAWLYYHTNADETKTVSGFDTFSKSGVPLFTIMQGTTLQDLIYDTKNTPAKPPYDENPVRFFRDVGTTVFKSGWDSDDFVFVMRTGPFYNHQHLDQGTFWLADRGVVFIEEHTGSSYYDDPMYESRYTQPIAHSTIIIDGNPQSQRTGDPKEFIDGFDDHADLYHSLDGGLAAFSSGDIGKLYHGKVKEMRRNVLYLKPRTILMLDTIIPADTDADVTELFQTRYLDEIDADHEISTITKESSALVFRHLSPDNRIVRAEEMPHFLRDFDEKPLRRRGYLSVTARTVGIPLVMANLLTTTEAGTSPRVETERGDGFIGGTIDGVPFAFTTQPGGLYQAGGYTTDALAVTWDDNRIFAALCTELTRNGEPVIESEAPITFDMGEGTFKYYLADDTGVAIKVPGRPKSLSVNGESMTFLYESARRMVVITLPAGEGTVIIE